MSGFQVPQNQTCVKRHRLTVVALHSRDQLLCRYNRRQQVNDLFRTFVVLLTHKLAMNLEQQHIIDRPGFWNRHRSRPFDRVTMRLDDQRPYGQRPTTFLPSRTFKACLKHTMGVSCCV
ncbi:hypothetical protein LFM09_44645 [Lentzea alba]|uniref:hypothetical protein n=1 Tax=Lentzea alba TaxID=2714351 RepID=UPI0039BF8092